MKKLLLLLGLLALLAGCSKYTGADFSAYKGQSSNQIFTQGEKNLAEGKYAQAVKDFEALDALYPFGDDSRQGQIDIIYAYYKNDDTASTLVAADRYIRLYPRGRDVDYAYYMKGLVYYKMGFTWAQRLAGSDPAPHDLADKQQAFMAFSELAHAFPNSPYAADAVRHMQYIRNISARKQLRVAQFYFDRKAFVAAANRSSYVVEHYNGTPSVKPALVLMVKSYRELGLSGMANNTLAILRATYPDASELRQFDK